MKELKIDKASAGQRMNKYLLKYFKNATSSFIYKMLRKKNIVLNGKKASGNEILKEEDQIKVFFSDETFEKMRGSQQAKADGNRLAKLERKPQGLAASIPISKHSLATRTSCSFSGDVLPIIYIREASA